MAVNPHKLNSFMDKAVGAVGPGNEHQHRALGDKLGLYNAMAKEGPVTPAELAKATKTTQRYVGG